MLESLKNSLAETASAEFHGGSRVEILFLDSAYQREKATIYECKLSELGHVLQASIESSIDNFGEAISPLEKRQILINILRRLV